MGNIGIIHNPFAKGNLKRPWIADRIRTALGGHGFVRETKNINELPKVAEEFLDRGVEVIGVNGGDGSLHLVLTAFIKAYGDRPLPKVMSLRGGTMNTVSNSLKIKGATLPLLKKVIHKLDNGEPLREMKQHILEVNGKFGFLSGAGIISNFLDAYYSGSGTGPWNAAKLIVKAVGGIPLQTRFVKQLIRPTPAAVELDGTSLEPDAYTVLLACTVRELGLGFTPTPRAYDKPGHFHFIAADLKAHQIVPMLPRIWLGKDLCHPRIQMSGAAAEVVIKPKGKLRWMVDGEMYDTDKPLHYKCGPTITIVAP